MWTRLGTWELHLPPINPKPWPPAAEPMELASIHFGFKLRQITRSPNENVNSRGTLIVEPQFEIRLHVCSSCQWLNERSRLSTTAMPYEQKIVGMLWRVLLPFRNPLSSKISEPFYRMIENSSRFVSDGAESNFGRWNLRSNFAELREAFGCYDHGERTCVLPNLSVTAPFSQVQSILSFLSSQHLA